MITANLNNGSLVGYTQEVVLRMMAKQQVKPMGDSEAPPLKARVNHGRWLVDCECNGAELAWDEGVFMCLSCFNAGHEHKYRTAIFPRNRKAIELLLMGRPVENRNWYPGESLAQLRAENEAHMGVN